MQSDLHFDLSSNYSIGLRLNIDWPNLAYLKGTYFFALFNS